MFSSAAKQSLLNPSLDAVKHGQLFKTLYLSLGYMFQAPTDCTALIALSSSRTMYTVPLGEKVTQTCGTVLLWRDTCAIKPKSELPKAKQCNYQARVSLLQVVFLNFKFPSLEAEVCCQHFSFKDINLRNEYEARATNCLIIRLLPLTARGLKAVPTNGTSTQLAGLQAALLGSESKSVSLVNSLLVVMKNCLSLDGSGIQSLCSSFEAKDKENVNNLKSAAF